MCFLLALTKSIARIHVHPFKEVKSTMWIICCTTMIKAPKYICKISFLAYNRVRDSSRSSLQGVFYHVTMGVYYVQFNENIKCGSFSEWARDIEGGIFPKNLTIFMTMKNTWLMRTPYWQSISLCERPCMVAEKYLNDKTGHFMRSSYAY